MTPGTVSSHRSSPSAMTGFWTLPGVGAASLTAARAGVSCARSPHNLARPTRGEAMMIDRVRFGPFPLAAS